MGQLGLMASYSYGGTFGDGEDNIAAAGTRPEWTLCAFDPAAQTESGQPMMATSFAAFPSLREPTAGRWPWLAFQ